MPRYKVTFAENIGSTIVVEAANAQEAEDAVASGDWFGTPHLQDVHDREVCAVEETDAPASGDEQKSYTVMIERTLVIHARNPQEAREKYLADLNAPTCLKVYENTIG